MVIPGIDDPLKVLRMRFDLALAVLRGRERLMNTADSPSRTSFGGGGPLSRVTQLNTYEDLLNFCGAGGVIGVGPGGQMLNKKDLKK